MPARPRKTDVTEDDSTVVVDNTPTNVFDWINGGAEPVTDSVEIMMGTALVKQLNDLYAQIQAAETGPARTMSQPAPAKLQREYEELHARYKASSAKFTFRQRVIGDWETLAKQMLDDGEKPKDIAEANVYATAYFMVEPEMTVDQVRAMIPVIGVVQYEQLIKCWETLAGKVVEPADPKSLRR